MSISKAKFTKTGNMIILILVFIIIITCFNCFFSINGLGNGANTNTNLGLIEGLEMSESEAVAIGGTDIASGQEEYIEGITRVSDTRNNLNTSITSLQNFTENIPGPIHGVDSLRQINSTVSPAIAPVAFTVVNFEDLNINRIYYADKDNNIRYFNADTPSDIIKLDYDETRSSAEFSDRISNLKYIQSDYGFYLVCIAGKDAYQSFFIIRRNR